MIELPDGNIALSSGYRPYTIVIIDSSSYEVKKEIYLGEKKIKYSSLCVFDKHSFICVYEGNFIQIAIKDHIWFKLKEEGMFNGYRGIIPIEGGKYFAIENNKGISIIKTYIA